MSIKSGSMNHSTIIADDERIHYYDSHTDVKSLYGKVCYHSDCLLSKIYKLSLHLNPFPIPPLTPQEFHLVEVRKLTNPGGSIKQWAIR